MIGSMERKTEFEGRGLTLLLLESPYPPPNRVQVSPHPLPAPPRTPLRKARILGLVNDNHSLLRLIRR